MIMNIMHNGQRKDRKWSRKLLCKAALGYGKLGHPMVTSASFLPSVSALLGHPEINKQDKGCPYFLPIIF